MSRSVRKSNSGNKVAPNHGNKWTEADEETIISELGEGTSMKDIAASIGRTPATTITRFNSIMKRMYEDGKSTKELAEMVGYKEADIKKIVSNPRTNTTSRSGNRKVPSKPSSSKTKKTSSREKARIVVTPKDEDDEEEKEEKEEDEEKEEKEEDEEKEEKEEDEEKEEKEEDEEEKEEEKKPIRSSTKPVIKGFKPINKPSQVRVSSASSKIISKPATRPTPKDLKKKSSETKELVPEKSSMKEEHGDFKRLTEMLQAQEKVIATLVTTLGITNARLEMLNGVMERIDTSIKIMNESSSTEEPTEAVEKVVEETEGKEMEGKEMSIEEAVEGTKTEEKAE